MTWRNIEVFPRICGPCGAEVAGKMGSVFFLVVTGRADATQSHFRWEDVDQA